MLLSQCNTSGIKSQPPRRCDEIQGESVKTESHFSLLDISLEEQGVASMKGEPKQEGRSPPQKWSRDGPEWEQGPFAPPSLLWTMLQQRAATP